MFFLYLDVVPRNQLQEGSPTVDKESGWELSRLSKRKQIIFLSAVHRIRTDWVGREAKNFLFGDTHPSWN